MTYHQYTSYAPAKFFCTKFSISRSTWWRLSTKSANFPTPIRFGRSVRWEIESVYAFLCNHV